MCKWLGILLNGGTVRTIAELESAIVREVPEGLTDTCASGWESFLTGALLEVLRNWNRRDNDVERICSLFIWLTL